MLKYHSYLLILLVMTSLLPSCSFNGMFYHTEMPLEKIPDSLNVEEIFIKTPDNIKVNILFVKPRVEVPKATILLLHGNAGNVSTWLDAALVMVRDSFQVFILDYRGYGKSEGSPTHENVYADAQQAFDYVVVREEVKNTKLIIWGYSLGGNLAVKVAYENRPKVAAIAIEGAFTSHNDIATALVPILIKPFARMLVVSPYKSKNLIGKLGAMPKLIIHSKDDDTVPCWMGIMNYERASDPKELWAVTGHHCHAITLFEKEYVKRFNKLLEKTCK